MTTSVAEWMRVNVNNRLLST